MWAWCDSKVVFCVSNVHPLILVTAQRRMKGRADQWEGPCPLPMREYNFSMGAIDDFDRLIINALHLWHIENPEEGQLLERRTWIAGLIEEILTKYGSKSGSGTARKGMLADWEDLTWGWLRHRQCSRAQKG
eukprot:3444031-Rhodomonas_salina.1